MLSTVLYGVFGLLGLFAAVRAARAGRVLARLKTRAVEVEGKALYLHERAEQRAVLVRWQHYDGTSCEGVFGLPRKWYKDRREQIPLLIDPYQAEIARIDHWSVAPWVVYSQAIGIFALGSVLLLRAVISAGTEPVEHEVTYYVEGTAQSVEVAIGDAPDYRSPLTPPHPVSETSQGIHVGSVKPGALLSIIANSEDGKATVICRIVVDGEEICRDESDDSCSCQRVAGRDDND